MNQGLYAVLSAHASWYASRFGEIAPQRYVFPWGAPQPSDPTRPTTSLKHAWESLRKAAAVTCRLHDLRHCFATALAEAGTPESTMLALMGHMSRRMLEKYSHIRLKAKREAMDSVSIVVPTISPTIGKSRHLHKLSSR
jgi:integrase